MTLDKAAALTWAALLVVLPFQRVWTLPWFESALQPPEVLGGVLIVLAIRRYVGGGRSAVGAIDVGVLGLAAAAVVALVLTDRVSDALAVREVVGLVYLAALYLSIRVLATPDWLDDWPRWYLVGATLAAVLAITGVALAMGGWVTSLVVWQSTPVPGLPAAYRAVALTAGPQMLAGTLIVAVVLQVWRGLSNGWTRRDQLQLVLFTVAMTLTLSKTILCLVAGLATFGLMMHSPRSRRFRSVALAACGSVATGAFLFVTHALPVRERQVPLMATAMIAGGAPLWQYELGGERWAVLPTTYTYNKMASVDAIRSRWPMGVGPAGQPAFAAALQAEGRYPAWIRLAPLREPHSTYLGSAAELGVFGVCALIGLMAGVAVAVMRGLLDPSTRLRWVPLVVIGVILLLEATAADLLNTRHYWIWLAVVGTTAITSGRLKV